MKINEHFLVERFPSRARCRKLRNRRNFYRLWVFRWERVLNQAVFACSISSNLALNLKKTFYLKNELWNENSKRNETLYLSAFRSIYKFFFPIISCLLGSQIQEDTIIALFATKAACKFPAFSTAIPKPRQIKQSGASGRCSGSDVATFTSRGRRISCLSSLIVCKCFLIVGKTRTIINIMCFYSRVFFLFSVQSFLLLSID